jgi:predicted nucleic acid-binding Zn ribbon protein
MNINHVGSRRLNILFCIKFSLLIISLISLMFPLSVLADTTSPVITAPANGATDIETTGVTFSWQALDEYTTGYTFQLSSSADFTSLIADEQVYGLTYTYSGTLGEGTKYYWRVQAYDPNPSDWTEAEFTTKGAGASSSETSSSANTTETTSTNQGGGTSFIDSIISYLSEIGWPLVGGMAFVLIVLIVLISMLLSKPKKKTVPGMGSTTMRPGMGPQNTCPACGTINTPDRKFCSNCGGNLMTGPAFQQRQAPAGPGGYSGGGLICSNCGSPIPPGRQFCGVCGNKVMPAQQPGFQTTQQQFSQPNNCTVCGSPLQPGQQFCANCGSNVSAGRQQYTTTYETEMFMCPICGASINKGTNPCPSCNTWLDWGR